MRRSIWGGLVLMMIVVCGLAACTFGEPPAAPAEQKPTVQDWQLVTYVPSEDAEHIVAKTVTVSAQELTPKTALQEMLKVDAAEEYPLFPQGTTVRSVTVDRESKVATADFSRELISQNVGGSLGEILMVYIIADTLTNLDEVDAVRFSVEGEHVDTLTGHMDLSQPVRRNEEIIVK